MFTTRPELAGTFGMVASTHWLASAAGMAVLEADGTAFDAAVAAGLVLQVVEPHMNGLGGEVPIVGGTGDGEVFVLDGQGPAGGGATVLAFSEMGLDLIPGNGLLPACVPAAFGTWLLLLQRYGRLPLRAVMQYAIGYARESGIPYGEGLIKNRYIGRTFIQPDQRLREVGVALKFNALPEALDGKRVILVDDTIVRGTTSRPIVNMLRAAGAREVHMRVHAPPVMWPCYLGVDMATRDDLIAANMTLDEIVAAMSRAGIDGSRTALWRFYERHGITFKKNFVCGRAEARGGDERAPTLDEQPRHV